MAIVHFQPMAMERVWGGRMLESHFRRPLPDASAPYGESWEMVDREEAQSIVTTGSYVGMTLHELWQTHRDQVFGQGLPNSERFPLLIKILDAREDLSIQVHPPARVAAALRDLGPGLGDVALRCCCFLEGLEVAEKRLGWAARSGKIVLRIALMRLRRHYDETYGSSGPLIG